MASKSNKSNERALNAYMFKARSTALGIEVDQHTMLWKFDLFHPSSRSLKEACSGLINEFGFSVGLPKWNRDPDYEVEGWRCQVVIPRRFTLEEFCQFDEKLNVWMRSRGGDIISCCPFPVPKRTPSTRAWEALWDKQIAVEERKRAKPQPYWESPEIDSVVISDLREDADSPWLHFCDFGLKGRSVFVADMRLGPAEDGLSIKLAPDNYISEVTLRIRDSRVVNSALRIRAQGTAPVRGSIIGQISTDQATIGFYDETRLRKCFNQDSEKLYAWGESAMNQVYQGGQQQGASFSRSRDRQYGVLLYDLGRGLILPFVTSGMGDGAFSIFELLVGGVRTGFEIRFFDC